MPRGAGNHGIAQGSEQRTGIEFGERTLRIVAKGAGARDGGGIGDGSGGARVAIDFVRAGAQDRERLAGMPGQLEGAGEGKMLVSAAGPGSPAPVKYRLIDS